MVSSFLNTQRVRIAYRPHICLMFTTLLERYLLRFTGRLERNRSSQQAKLFYIRPDVTRRPDDGGLI
jgi:hypothetical protein